ncbi:MAG TPA: DEAD/DEAH box helicase [Solirubrobacteraceae bacterium]|nr:DEAD/DEAH box helicase [Solirubrobacteraceae bacterium]
MAVVDVPYEIDLREVARSVGKSTYDRGAAYARKHRVLSLEWDEDELAMTGKVLGTGLYTTTVRFSDLGDGIEFDFGECTCPIGFDCKHVAAVAVMAAGSATPQTRGDDAVKGAAKPAREVTSESRPPSWQERLRPLVSAPNSTTVGSPLAVELSVTAGHYGRGQRLQAKLMRPGARGGWVNGSLSWNRLEPWDHRDLQIREDHLALARELKALTAAHGAGRYMYGYGGQDKLLDLTDVDGGRFWSLLEEAEALGIVLLDSDRRGVEVPRYRTAELLIDVTVGGDGAAEVKPVLRDDAASATARRMPVLFLGVSGHGLVVHEVPDVPTDSETRDLRLIRLSRPTPEQLRLMVLGGERLTVPPGELAAFATEIAPGLRNIAPVVSGDGSFTTPEVSPPALVLNVSHQPGHVTFLGWQFRYVVGDRTIEADLVTSHGGDPAAAIRDRAAERALLDELDVDRPALRDLGVLDVGGRPARGTIVLEGFDTARFVADELPVLTAALEVTETGEPIDYRDVADSLRIEVSTTEQTGGEQDWFDLDVTITVAGHKLPFAVVFAALARGETRLLLDDGAHFSLLAPELDALRGLIAEAESLGDGSRPGSLRISRYQATLWDELVKLGIVGRQAQAWQLQLEALRGLDGLTDHDPAATFAASLRPYQLDGFKWLATLWELGLGGILADDMGLGKTIQALALVTHAIEAGADNPFLVVAPTSVVPNWIAEARRFAPDLATRAITDTHRKLGATIADTTDGAQLVVTTYTLLRLDADVFASRAWAGALLDEAQHVKNHSGKTHQTVRRVEAPFKLAITGTPMENNLTELWALLSITSPGLFPDPRKFTEFWARPIERNGDKERLTMLRRRIRPLVKRRTKELVAAELPARQEQELAVELHPRHRKVYDTHLQRERKRILGLLDDFDRNRLTVLTAITKLRQLSLHAGLVDTANASTPSAKIDELIEQLADVIGGGHRALVFSQFTGFLATVRDRLEAEAIEYCYLDGKTRNREKVLGAFKQGHAPVFLISLKAGGAGLNLTEADYVFVLDPWWNPAVEAQAIDRSHRLGQTKPVMAYRLVSRNTIEEKVVALAKRKAALFTGVMDDGDLFSGQITAADIAGLLS